MSEGKLISFAVVVIVRPFFDRIGPVRERMVPQPAVAFPNVMLSVDRIAPPMEHGNTSAKSSSSTPPKGVCDGL